MTALTVTPARGAAAAAQMVAQGRGQDGSGYLLAVIPASERLDLHKLLEHLGAGREIRLATGTRS